MEWALLVHPEIVRECNRIAIRGIYACAGNYRDRVVVAGDFVPAHHVEPPDIRQLESMLSDLLIEQLDS